MQYSQCAHKTATTVPRVSPNLECNDMILNNSSAKTNSKRVNSELWQNKFVSQSGGEYTTELLLNSTLCLVKKIHFGRVKTSSHFANLSYSTGWFDCVWGLYLLLLCCLVMFCLLMMPSKSLRCKIVWTLFCWFATAAVITHVCMHKRNTCMCVCVLPCGLTPSTLCTAVVWCNCAHVCACARLRCLNKSFLERPLLNGEVALMTLSNLLHWPSTTRMLIQPQHLLQ